MLLAAKSRRRSLVQIEARFAWSLTGFGPTARLPTRPKPSRAGVDGVKHLLPAQGSPEQSDTIAPWRTGQVAPARRLPRARR
jgi:hypothetical protein